MDSEDSLHKADFDAIYDQPDPRAYYSTLAPLDYQIPRHGAEVASRLLAARPEPRPAPTVLDVCCSYGVLAMLLKTDVDLDGLSEHYRSPSMVERNRDQVADADRSLLKEHGLPAAPRVVGLDVASNAVDYAVTTNALDDGAIENLETQDPSERLAGLVGDVDLVTTTGGVGYVTRRTFDRLLDAVPPTAWFATFCLRTYDFAPIAESMSAHGRRTESLPGTFRQRRFTDPDEQQWALSEVSSYGLDPTGKEADGYFHAELHVSRPAEDVDRVPLEPLLAGVDVAT